MADKPQKTSSEQSAAPNQEGNGPRATNGTHLNAFRDEAQKRLKEATEAIQKAQEALDTYTQETENSQP